MSLDENEEGNIDHDRETLYLWQKNYSPELSMYEAGRTNP
jgi:hypothetical protein